MNTKQNVTIKRKGFELTIAEETIFNNFVDSLNKQGLHICVDEVATENKQAKFPKIGSEWNGGIYAGISVGENGEPDAHLILLPDEKELNWNDGIEWAKSFGNGAHMPTQSESALLLANWKDKFKERWHWTSTQASADNAFAQYFGDGYQGYFRKDRDSLVRPVRRINNLSI